MKKGFRTNGGKKTVILVVFGTNTGFWRTLGDRNEGMGVLKKRRRCTPGPLG